MDNNDKAAGLFLFLMFAASTCMGKLVTIEAAFRSADHKVTILTGGEMGFVYSNKLIVTKSQGTLNIPLNLHVKAAVTSLDDNDSVMYYGDKNGYFVNNKNGRQKTLRYGPNRPFVRDGDVDAAARKGDKMYFFKGCDMVIRRKWNRWGKAKDMRTVGLPCHVDAAWKQGDEGMTLLRGDQIWIWNGDGSVAGPEPFNATYSISPNVDWELAPYTANDE